MPTPAPTAQQPISFFFFFFFFCWRPYIPYRCASMCRMER
jgi:hypothetical protein